MLRRWKMPPKRQLFVGLTLLLASKKKDSICNWYDLATQRD
jgi:hypothetical protein